MLARHLGLSVLRLSYQLSWSFHLGCFGLPGWGHHLGCIWLLGLGHPFWDDVCAIDCDWLMDSTIRILVWVEVGASDMSLRLAPRPWGKVLHLRNYYKYCWKSLCLYKLWRNFLQRSCRPIDCPKQVGVIACTGTSLWYLALSWSGRIQITGSWM